MKIQLNRITNYEGRTLRLGDEIDLPLNVAQRWINKGIAHVPMAQGGIVKSIPKLNDDLILNKTQMENLEKMTTNIGKPITEPLEEIKVNIGEIGELAESIIFREPEEPESVFYLSKELPEDVEETVVDIKTGKTSKPKKKK